MFPQPSHRALHSITAEATLPSPISPNGSPLIPSTRTSSVAENVISRLSSLPENSSSCTLMEIVRQTWILGRMIRWICCFGGRSGQIWCGGSGIEPRRLVSGGRNGDLMASSGWRWTCAHFPSWFVLNPRHSYVHHTNCSEIILCDFTKGIELVNTHDLSELTYTYHPSCVPLPDADPG